MERKNVVNPIVFLRGEDHREDKTELVETFYNHAKVCKELNLPCTFLMQYDVLTKPEYTDYFKKLNNPDFEAGVWIEMAQEQVEKCGIEWRGRPGMKWDWFVNPDMLMAYTLEEKKLLLDELFNKFYEVFGYYPKSVGSWLVDSDSINYLKEKYDIKAACICKEQVGTDGYTLWGGYYNQGYYPSKENLLCPAQTKEYQIDVPVFRMLGCDPIKQYDCGMDENFNSKSWQPVYTLEPMYQKNMVWSKWFYNCNFKEEGMSFSHTHVGQENSFVWRKCGHNATEQYKIAAEGRDRNDWEVLTLGDTGEWFLNRFDSTPSTCFVGLKDEKCFDHDDLTKKRQSVWFNSKQFRANIYSDINFLGLRDIFYFNEKVRDKYLDTPETGNCAKYGNLPVIDGYRWGGNGTRAGIWVSDENGNILSGEIQKVEPLSEDALCVYTKVENDIIKFICCSEYISVEFNNSNYCLKFQYTDSLETNISFDENNIKYNHNGTDYIISTDSNIVSKDTYKLLKPVDNKITFKF